MQATLHEHAGAAHLDRLSYLSIDRFKVENVAFCCELTLEWTIERAEAAVLRAEIRVVDVAVDDVGDDALGMQFAAQCIRFHAETDQVVGAKIIESLSPGDGHRSILRVG